MYWKYFHLVRNLLCIVNPISQPWYQCLTHVTFAYIWEAPFELCDPLIVTEHTRYYILDWYHDLTLSKKLSSSVAQLVLHGHWILQTVGLSLPPPVVPIFTQYETISWTCISICPSCHSFVSNLFTVKFNVSVSRYFMLFLYIFIYLFLNFFFLKP